MPDRTNIIFMGMYNILYTIGLKKLAHNVPAVCDGLAVAIKECEAFQQPQKCGGEKPHKGR
jgi:hypothetical protein